MFGGNNVLEKVLGNWTISGILNWRSGFPWTPLYKASGDCPLGFSGSVGSGDCYLRPAVYLGGADNSFDDEVFITSGGQFPNGATSYFTAPVFPAGATFPASSAVPAAPGVGRNSFRGPHALNLDMTLSKAFGLPKLPALGENAQIEFRASAYNVLNKLNLSPFNFNSSSTVVSTEAGATSSTSFGRAESGLPGRVVELQARFSF